MNKIIEVALEAVPCSARKGLLCDAPHKFWASCCRLVRAIRAEGIPLEEHEIPPCYEPVLPPSELDLIP